MDSGGLDALWNKTQDAVNIISQEYQSIYLFRETLYNNSHCSVLSMLYVLEDRKGCYLYVILY